MDCQPSSRFFEYPILPFAAKIVVALFGGYAVGDVDACKLSGYHLYDFVRAEQGE